jgi:hypothetical protein
VACEVVEVFVLDGAGLAVAIVSDPIIVKAMTLAQKIQLLSR